MKNQRKIKERERGRERERERERERDGHRGSFRPYGDHVSPECGLGRDQESRQDSIYTKNAPPKKKIIYQPSFDGERLWLERLNENVENSIVYIPHPPTRFFCQQKKKNKKKKK